VVLDAASPAVLPDEVTIVLVPSRQHVWDPSPCLGLIILQGQTGRTKAMQSQRLSRCLKLGFLFKTEFWCQVSNSRQKN